jgi:Arc/MetJ-type ribon-helix-helix transcriptional regulator
MPAVERMTVTMPAEMAETLRRTVAGGEYASTSEVVREALREWTRSRDAERRDLDALRAASAPATPTRRERGPPGHPTCRAGGPHRDRRLHRGRQPAAGPVLRGRDRGEDARGGRAAPELPDARRAARGPAGSAARALPDLLRGRGRRGAGCARPTRGAGPAKGVRALGRSRGGLPEAIGPEGAEGSHGVPWAACPPRALADARPGHASGRRWPQPW